jgi:5,10-methylenetetrahydrofolate reductase
VVTVEVAPPDSPDPAALLERARNYEGLVDAINITDSAGGNCHISSLSASVILNAHGFTSMPGVLPRSEQDGIQGDVLGAAALGVRNVLCLTGDDVGNGRVSASADQKAEGKQFLVETIRALATIEGVAGVHVMGFRNEKLLAEAIRESGVRLMSRVAASKSTALQQRAAV